MNEQAGDAAATADSPVSHGAGRDGPAAVDRSDGSAGGTPDVDDPAGGTPSGGTEVIETPGPAVERSPSDVLRMVVAGTLLAILFAVQALFGDTVIAFLDELLRGLDALPSWIAHTIVVGTRILAAVLLVGGLVVTVLRGRGRLLATVVTAGVVAGVLALLLDPLSPDSAGAVVDLNEDAVGPFTARGFPTAAGVAVVAAVLTAAAPWLSRPWRRLGWLLVAGVVVTRFFTAPVSFDSMRNALVGWLVGAAVLVALGGPRRRPPVPRSPRGWPRSGCRSAARAGQRRRPRLHALLRRRGATGGGCSSRRSARTSAAPTCCSGSTGGSTAATSATSDRSRRCAARSSTRPWSPWPPRDMGIRTPRLVAFATAEPERLRARLRGHRRPQPRSARTRRGHRPGAGRHLGPGRRSCGGTASPTATCAWPTCSSPTTGRCGSSTSGSASWPPRTCCSPTTSPSCSRPRPCRSGPSGRWPSPTRSVGPGALSDALDRLHPWALSGATRTGLKEEQGLLDELRREVGKVAEVGDAVGTDGTSSMT